MEEKRNAFLHGLQDKELFYYNLDNALLGELIFGKKD